MTFLFSLFLPRLLLPSRTTHPHVQIHVALHTHAYSTYTCVSYVVHVRIHVLFSRQNYTYPDLSSLLRSRLLRSSLLRLMPALEPALEPSPLLYLCSAFVVILHFLQTHLKDKL